MRSAWLAVTLVVLLGCGSVAPWTHTPDPVAGLPGRFIADSSFPNAPASDTTCMVHLIDPASQTRLLLQRSTFPAQVSDTTVRSAMGDYKVEPEGRYGIDVHHLLRVRCTTGTPLGKVPE